MALQHGPDIAVSAMRDQTCAAPISPSENRASGWSLKSYDSWQTGLLKTASSG